MFNFNFKNTEKGGEENYHNNIPVKTEAEVYIVSVLEEKINDTKEAIKAIEEESLNKGMEISPESKELIESLKNKVRDYTIKLGELKNEENIPEPVEVLVNK